MIAASQRPCGSSVLDPLAMAASAASSSPRHTRSGRRGVDRSCRPGRWPGYRGNGVPRRREVPALRHRCARRRDCVKRVHCPKAPHRRLPALRHRSARADLRTARAIELPGGSSSADGSLSIEPAKITIKAAGPEITAAKVINSSGDSLSIKVKIEPATVMIKMVESEIIVVEVTTRESKPKEEDIGINKEHARPPGAHNDWRWPEVVRVRVDHIRVHVGVHVWRRRQIIA